MKGMIIFVVGGILGFCIACYAMNVDPNEAFDNLRHDKDLY